VGKQPNGEEHLLNTMDASIIICTYNRSDSLKRTLSSLASMNHPMNRSWEIVVVDNNSSDGTKSVVQEFSRRCEQDVIYLCERTQGKSFALNHGIEAARGEILAFTDDDVRVHADWLKNILRNFNETDASCLGGKILLEWDVSRPEWLGRFLVDQLGYLDLGEEKVRLSLPKIYGANLAVRTGIIRKHGGFDTQAGPIAEKMYTGEDTFFIERLIRAGETVLYSPEIIVHHCIPKSHIKKSYFLKRMFDQGEYSGIQMGIYKHRNLIGIPFYMYKELLSKILQSIIKLTSHPSEAFKKQIDLVMCLGFMKGRWKFMKSKTGISIA
jgi:glucosyl-dolichyl phosphate glucuronosyltransferase